MDIELFSSGKPPFSYFFRSLRNKSKRFAETIEASSVSFLLERILFVILIKMSTKAEGARAYSGTLRMFALVIISHIVARLYSFFSMIKFPVHHLAGTRSWTESIELKKITEKIGKYGTF